MAKALEGRAGVLSLSLDKVFAGKASPGPNCLPLSLWGRVGVGQVGEEALAGGPVRRAGQHRLRRHLPPPVRTTCWRGRCSPPMSQQGGISNISTHLIPWLRRQIWSRMSKLDCHYGRQFWRLQCFWKWHRCKKNLQPPFHERYFANPEHFMKNVLSTNSLKWETFKVQISKNY